MYINQIFEPSMVLVNDKFQKVLNRAYDKNDYLDENGKEYIDRSLESKGIVVTYRDSQYKKKVKLMVNSRLLLDCNKPFTFPILCKTFKYAKTFSRLWTSISALNIIPDSVKSSI